MKTNNVVIENIRGLGTDGPGAGTWSLSVSVTGLTFLGGKKIITMARKERKMTKEQRQGIQRTR